MEVLDMDVYEEELVEDKVAKLDLAVKESNKKIADVYFEYEIKISVLQMKLQLAMPLEVHGQREIDLKIVVTSISETLVECGKLLDETLQIWTSLQEGPNVQNIEDDIQKN